MSRILERCANEQMKTIFRRRRIEKFFGAAVLQKCCRGVGEQPTFAKQIVFEMVAIYEPQATEKFFGAAVFQKCCRGVGE